MARPNFKEVHTWTILATPVYGHWVSPIASEYTVMAGTQADAESYVWEYVKKLPDVKDDGTPSDPPRTGWLISLEAAETARFSAANEKQGGFRVLDGGKQ